MEFNAIPSPQIQEYLGAIGSSIQPLSVILTDGTVLTGQYMYGHRHGLTLEAGHDLDSICQVTIPPERVAGILEQVLAEPENAPAPDASLLVPAAKRAGLEVELLTYPGGIDPGPAWVPSGPVRYREDSWLYLDSSAISARLGGINSIGFGVPIASASIGWGSKLVSKAKGLLKRDVADVGAHCTAPHRTLS